MNLISLGIGKFELDWSKHHIRKDFSNLFQDGDNKNINYYYFDANYERVNTVELNGFSKPLTEIKQRLDLLGYDLNSIEERFDDNKNEYERYLGSSHFSFLAVYKAIYNLDICSIDIIQQEMNYGKDGYDLGEYFKSCFLTVDSIRNKIIDAKMRGVIEKTKGRFDECDIAWFMESLDPYIVLRILAENPKNQDLEVQWRYLDQFDDQEEVMPGLFDNEQIMIVTEGSSDAKILKKAIRELYPSISDFFCFIDVTDNYPFTGASSLLNFCKGLCKIKIQNNMIVLFDNDTEGTEKYNEALLLDAPDSMVIMKLPYYSGFELIDTVGPQGKSLDNINGKAVAIECFLDFDSITTSPLVRWTSYNRKIEAYQGELEKKEEYTKSFLKSDLKAENYNTQKIELLIQSIIDHWINRNKTNQNSF